ncbi:hypothetical protein FHL15_007571 [Xylaria flabelliformis]|uniref:Uncharacterized protein n=1 Tax=Xylaria flabelliformis TaxID=2512241 RepID=A0A553HUD3_9PEZI|nr:hypothetical protein FHL15_007571 [Xylaria flabelliformis]
MDSNMDNPDPSSGEQNPDVVKKPVVVPEYQLRMSHGWTVTDGTYDPIPQDKRRKRDVPYPSYVNHTFRTRSALSSLQISRNAPIKAAALDIAFDHLWKCMPGAVRRYLHIASPNGPDLWSADEAAKDAMYKIMEEEVYQLPVYQGSTEMIYRFFADITKRPWIILPIWVEDEWGSDWIIVIWFSRALPEQPDYYNQLIAYGIIDSRRSPTPDSNGRHPPIQARLERIRFRLCEFWNKAGFNLENARIMEVFSSPMPLGEASSGERSFAIVKGLISQIIDWFTSGMEFDPQTTIKSMTQWVNPYQQRIELTGINAWVLMASLDYNARVTVEALLPNTRTEVACDGKKKFIYNYDLAGPFTEPPIASYDYNLPGNQDFKAPPGQTKPNNFWDYAD